MSDFILFRIIRHNYLNGEATLGTFVLSELTSDHAMPQVGEEIAECLKNCALSQSILHTFPAQPIMWSINEIYGVLAQHSYDNGGDDSLLNLYRNAIITPTNIQMLFHMCDAENRRPGDIRCRALSLLAKFVEYSSPAWSMQIMSRVFTQVFTPHRERFLNCLATVPADRDTKALVRRARIALIETMVVNLESNRFDSSECIQLLNFDEYARCHLSRWQELHTNESDSARWIRLEATFLDSTMLDRRIGPSGLDGLMTDLYSLTAWLQAEHEKEQSARTNNHGEKCANCSVLETTFRQECSERLMACSKCHILYCSRECQREHWKRHKKECNKVKQGKTGSKS